MLINVFTAKGQAAITLPVKENVLPPIQTDTSTTKSFDSILSVKNILNKPVVNDSSLNNAKQALKNTRHIDKPNLSVHISGGISNYFQSNNGTIYASSENESNDLHYWANLTLNTLPVSISGDVYQYNFSPHPLVHTYSIDFNYQQFVENLKQQLISKLKTAPSRLLPSQDSLNNFLTKFKSIQDQVNDPKSLLQTAQSKYKLDSLVKLQKDGNRIVGSMQGKMNGNSLQGFDRVLSDSTVSIEMEKLKFDSLQKICASECQTRGLDSACGSDQGIEQNVCDGKIDSVFKANERVNKTIDSLKNEIKKYNDLRGEYSKLFVQAKDVLKKYGSLNFQDIVHTPDIVSEVKSMSLEELKSKLQENRIISKSLLWLTNFKSLSVGEGCLNNSPLTVWNTYIKGMQLLYESSFTVGFAHGKQTFIFPGNLPVTGNAWGVQDKQVPSSVVTMLRIGPGTIDKRFLHLSISNIHRAEQGFSNVPSSSSPVNNSVVSLMTGLQDQKNNFSIQSEIGSSFSSFHSASAEIPLIESQVSKKNIAYGVELKKEFIKASADFQISWNHADPFYKTLGNPYLLSGTNTMDLSGSKSFFKDRIKLQSGLKSVEYKQGSNYSFAIRQLSYFIDVNSKIGNSTSLLLRYNPSIFRTTNTALISSKTTLFTVQINSSATVFQKQLNSLVSVSNFNYNNGIIPDMNSANGINAISMCVCETFNLSASNSIIATCTSGSNFSKPLDIDYLNIFAGDNLIILKNKQLSVGGTMSNYIGKAYLGGRVSVSWPVLKSATVNFFCDWKDDSSNGFNVHDGLYSASGSFAYSF